MDEVPINGDGFGLTLGVAGYEAAASGEMWDDTWLRGFVRAEIAQPPGAAFRAKCDVAWQTTELHAFHESLRTLLDDLTGTAKLTTIEDQVELTIDLNSGKGTLTGRVEAHAIAALEFEAATDQTFLAVTLAAYERRGEVRVPMLIGAPPAERLGFATDVAARRTTVPSGCEPTRGKAVSVSRGLARPRASGGLRNVRFSPLGNGCLLHEGENRALAVQALRPGLPRWSIQFGSSSRSGVHRCPCYPYLCIRVRSGQNGRDGTALVEGAGHGAQGGA